MTRRAVVFPCAVSLAGAGLVIALMLAARQRVAAPAQIKEVRPAAGGVSWQPTDTYTAPLPSAGARLTVESLRQRDLIDAVAVLDGESAADAAFLFEAYSAVLEPAVSNGNFRFVRSILETTPRADVRALLKAALADVWARRAPAEAAAWIASCSSEPERARALGDAMTTWAASDAEAAVAFAVALPPGDVRQAAVAGAMLQWRTRDLAGASEWLAGREAHPDFDVAIAALATDPTLVGVDPTTAMGWAGGIANEEVRLTAMADIAHAWALRDGSAARVYLQTTPLLTDAQRARVSVLIAARNDGGSS